MNSVLLNVLWWNPSALVMEINSTNQEKITFSGSISYIPVSILTGQILPGTVLLKFWGDTPKKLRISNTIYYIIV